MERGVPLEGGVPRREGCHLAAQPELGHLGAAVGSVSTAQESLHVHLFVPYRTHMQDLKDVTNNVHYENYRSRKLAAVTYNGVDNNKNRGQLTK